MAVDAVAGQLLGTLGEVAMPVVQVQGVVCRKEAKDLSLPLPKITILKALFIKVLKFF